MSGITVKLDILASFLPFAVQIEIYFCWMLKVIVPAHNIKMQAVSDG
jgi:hypothetical protein